MNGLKLIAVAGLVMGLVMVAGTAWGQVEVEWERTYQLNDYGILGGMILTADGGFAIAGTEDHNQPRYSDFWLQKLDSMGDTIWSRSYGTDRCDVSKNIVQTTDGGYVIGGQSYFNDGYYAEFVFSLIKVNADGDSIWCRRYFRLGLGFCNAMIATQDGGFALAGSRLYKVFDGVSRKDSITACLIKTDQNGEMSWIREYQSSDFRSLVQTSDGGYALVGNTSTGGEITIVRIASNGDSLWSSYFQVNERDYAYEIIETNGRFAVVGSTGTDWVHRDALLLMVNSEGGMLWYRTYGRSEHYHHLSSIKETIDGGFIMVGSSSTNRVRSSDGWFLRVNAEGDSLWSLLCGGIGGDDFSSVEVTPDEGYVAYGNRQGMYWLVKTTPDPVSVREPSPLAPSTLLLAPAYPNPFNSRTSIPFSIAKPGKYAVDVVDISGRLVERISDRWRAAGSYREVWDAAGVPAGEYMIRLKAGEAQGVTRVQIVR